MHARHFPRARLQFLQRIEPRECRLVAVAGDEVVGSAGLHIAGMSLCRAHRAMALYRSLGFVEEGRHGGYALKGGRYVDSLSMARLHPNPPSPPAGTASNQASSGTPKA